MKFLHLQHLAAVMVCLVFLVPGNSCSRREGAERKPEAASETSRDPLLAERIARDEAFRTSADSPIPPDERESFRGLNYYPVNVDLRYTVRLNRYPQPEQIRLSTNAGEIRSGLRYGYFDFTVDGTACRLQVYRLDDVSVNGSPNLFIPFRDATSGKETYASGRYIDLAENTTGIYQLDFNRAYNPYCAFNSSYICPFPPPENTLSVPIRAGEKIYKPAAGNK